MMKRRVDVYGEKLPYNEIVGKRRVIILIVVILAVVTAAVLFFIFGKFDDYENEGTLTLENAQRTQYESFSDRLLSYNLDGASLTDFGGNMIWNITYEMQDPRVEKRDACALIYDRQGTQMEIVTESGSDGSIRTSLPITIASISDKETVAVAMQEESTAHLQVCRKDGQLLASGELHLSDSGYPLSMALSPDGQRLAVSTIHLMEGDVKSEIIFFDFSEDGSMREDNKAGTYSYLDMVIPEITYGAGNRLLAFGDREIMIFGDQDEPQLENEIFFDEEIRSICFNDAHFGVITDTTTAQGEIAERLTIYNMRGVQRYTRLLDQSYSVCRLLDNDEVFLTNGRAARIFTSLGVEKFSCDFTEELTDMMPGITPWDYYILQDGEISHIRLRW